jgi:hypothetical protein
MITLILRKQSIVKINGIPFELSSDAPAKTAEENYKLFLSQSEHCDENPSHAASPVSRVTKSESLGSI